MNGDMMYLMARLHMAEQERIAAQRRLARSAREPGGWFAAWRTRHARPQPQTPVIPDYVHELLGTSSGDPVPAPRQPDPSRPSRQVEHLGVIAVEELPER